MGNITKNITKTILSAALVVTLVPAMALEALASPYVHREGTDQTSSGAKPTTSIKLYVDDSDAFRIAAAFGSGVVNVPIGSDDEISVVAVNGDFGIGGSTYTAKWWRQTIKGDVEESAKEYCLAGNSAKPWSNEIAIQGANPTEFSHSLSGDEFVDGTRYYYYVELTDSTGTVATDASHLVPIEVFASSNYAQRNFNTPPWSVSTTDDSVEIGAIHKSVTRLDVNSGYTGSETSGVFKDLADKAAAADMSIVRPTGENEGAPTVAAWDLVLQDASSDASAFEQELLVTLDAKTVLGNDYDPAIFNADNYTVVYAGNTVTMGALTFDSDAGTVSFRISKAQDLELATSALGSFALARKIATSKFDIWLAQGIENGKFDYAGALPYSCEVGATPEFTFSANDGYEPDVLSVYYADTTGKPTGSAVITHLYNEGSLENTFQFPNTHVVSNEGEDMGWTVGSGADWTRDAYVTISFRKKEAPGPNDPTTFSVNVGVGDNGCVEVSGVNELSQPVKEIISEGRTRTVNLKSGSKTTFDIVPNAGFAIEDNKVWVTNKADASEIPSVAGGWTRVSVTNGLYTVDALEFDFRLSVRFVAKAPDPSGITYTVRSEVLSAPDTGTIILANEEHSKGVAPGSDVTFVVRPAAGHVLESARIYRQDADGIEEAGEDLAKTNAYDARIGSLVVSNVQDNTVVYCVFTKKISDDNSNGGQGVTDGSGEVGQIESPAPATVGFEGAYVRGGDGYLHPIESKIIPSTDRQFVAGCQQTFAVFPVDAAYSDYVIDYVIVTETKGDTTATRKIRIPGGVNYATVDIIPGMMVSAVMRPVDPSHDKGAINEGDMKSIKTTTSEKGGLVTPAIASVVEGHSQTIAIRPDATNEAAGEHYYWTIDSVMLDDALLIPYTPKDPAHPEQGNGVFFYDPSTGKGHFTNIKGDSTGETFSYNPLTGVLVIDNPKSNHEIHADFQPAVDVEVKFVASNGSTAANTYVWKMLKEGSELRVVTAPREDYWLEEFLVNGVSRMDSLSNPSEDDIANLRTYALKAQNVRAGNERGLLASLSDLFGVKSAYATDKQTGGLAALDSETGLDLSQARSYVLQKSDLPTSGHEVTIETTYATDKSSGTDEPIVPSDKNKFTLTAKVASGKGSIDGKQEASIIVERGGQYRFELTPDAGYQVVKIIDNGTVVNGTRTSYLVNNVDEDHMIEVYFAFVSGGGSDSAAAKTLRKISAILNTGDGALPLAIAALGVALGATGVAVLIGKRRRDERR